MTDITKEVDQGAGAGGKYSTCGVLLEEMAAAGVSKLKLV